MRHPDKQIMALTRVGCCPETISEHLEIPVQRVRDRQRSLFNQNLDEGRVLTALNAELARLDRMREPFFDAALAGNVAAANVTLQVHDRVAKLMGLNAPERFESDQKVTYNFNFMPPSNKKKPEPKVIDAEVIDAD